MVFFARIADMHRLRCSGVRTSAIRSISRFRIPNESQMASKRFTKPDRYCVPNLTGDLLVQAIESVRVGETLKTCRFAK